MSQRQLNVIYCDDVRQEVGNKQSFIGVYAADLIVDRLPALLPKFCVVATLYTPNAQPFDNLRIRVLMDEQCVFDTQDIVMTPAEGAQVIAESNTTAEREGDMQANIVMVLAPLQIDHETTLQVVADVDGESMRSRLLRVTRRWKWGQIYFPVQAPRAVSEVRAARILLPGGPKINLSPL